MAQQDLDSVDLGLEQVVEIGSTTCQDVAQDLHEVDLAQTDIDGNYASTGFLGEHSEFSGATPAGEMVECQFCDVGTVNNISKALLEALAAASIQLTSGTFNNPASSAKVLQPELEAYMRDGQGATLKELKDRLDQFAEANAISPSICFPQYCEGC
eukprot:gene19119-22860_t